MDNQIICPKCGHKIDVSKVLYTQIEQEIKSYYEKDYQHKQNELNLLLAQIEEQRKQNELERARINQKIQEELEKKILQEKALLEKSIKEKILEENRFQIEALKNELNEKSEKIKELNNALIEIERLKREKNEIQEKMKLEFERQLTEHLRNEQEKIKKLYEEEYLLKIREKEKTIEDLTTKLEEAKRRAEQGSMQLQGEIQELELERILAELFPDDEIREVKKGQRGADALQIVRNKIGRECGKILYESKRTKNFDRKWIAKLKEDNLEEKADVLVIVTQAMPEGYDKFFYEDGVWICSFSEIKPFAAILRYMLLQIHNVTVINEGRETKMQLIYNYLTSREFADTFEAIINGFRELQKGYQDEKLKIQKIWKEREKQLEKILSSSINLYGSIKGLAGSAIPDIKLLEE